ncbi:hypothetical protein SCA03_01610 [Streptomyces cacaoi]|uniref:Uncharacterized protein n=1 Tax=Streptomyces cacaoi TaxID=1898 RepID=A0A4Y3QUA4_STRCI|nr:hypothetical protein SCA03_01610 [Streptomyces cacaoi]
MAVTSRGNASPLRDPRWAGTSYSLPLATFERVKKPGFRLTSWLSPTRPVPAGVQNSRTVTLIRPRNPSHSGPEPGSVRGTPW